MILSVDYSDLSGVSNVVLLFYEDVQLDVIIMKISHILIFIMFSDVVEIVVYEMRIANCIWKVTNCRIILEA